MATESAVRSQHSQSPDAQGADQGVPQFDPRPQRGEPPPHPRRVLVAEDEYLVATELTHALASLGYIVVGPATDGEAAVALTRSANPDLAIMDVRMPRRDGISAARELWELHNVPAIMVSAYSDQETVDAAAQTGVFGYLVKPASVDQIRAAIGIAWERYRRASVLEAENAHLKKRLEERKLIEQAKWILVSKKGATEPEAMQMLQRRARDTRRPLGDIARAVIEAEGLLG